MDKNNIKFDDVDKTLSEMYDYLVPAIDRLFNIAKKMTVKKEYYFRKKGNKYKKFKRRFYGKKV